MSIDVDKVNNLLAMLEKCVGLIRNEVNGSNQPIVTVTLGRRNPNRVELSALEQPDPRRLLDSEEWPVAVPPDLLCSAEDREDKVARAEQILDMTVDRDLAGVRFLDYGCGGGWVAWATLDRGVAEATGYDPNPDPGWVGLSRKSLRLTDAAESLKPSHYDVVMLYDVLDHCERPLEALNHVQSLLAPGGLVYVRCHPWTSRHGGHLYRSLNKAYAHLALTDAEVRQFKGDAVKKVLRPLKTYKDWFSVAGFKVRREDVKPNTPEMFFRDRPEVKDLLFRHWAEERHREPPLSDAQIFSILGIEFFDAVLTSMKSM